MVKKARQKFKLVSKDEKITIETTDAIEANRLRGQGFRDVPEKAPEAEKPTETEKPDEAKPRSAKK